MTSHYARCVVEAPFDSVFESLRQRFGNVYFRQFIVADGHGVGVILGEQYFFRVNSDVAVTVILQAADEDTTVLEIVSCAGGTGMLEVSYAAHKTYVSDVRKHLEKNFVVKVEEEIPYYPSRP